MTKILSSLNLKRGAVLVLLLFTSCVIFIRSYYRVASGDELIYQYVWEENDPTDPWTDGHHFDRKITSFQDIWQTQVIHYKLINGRSIVHGIEQAFTDHELMFGVINTIVFIIFVFLIVRCVTPGQKEHSDYTLWISILTCLLFFFPFKYGLYTSVNTGLNYLWPATMSVAFLFFWYRLLTGQLSSRWNFPIAIFSLIFGWTHEGFVVPLAAATFVFYCIHLKKFNWTARCLCIPFWVTATLMTFSPGNITRFFGHDEGPVSSSTPYKLIYTVLDGLNCSFHLWLIWLVIIGVVYLLIINRKRLRSFVEANQIYFLTIAFGFPFCLIAHSDPKAFTLVELVALIIVFRFISTLSWKLPSKIKSGLSIGYVILISIFFFGGQTLITKDHLYIYMKNKGRFFLTSRIQRIIFLN